MKKITKADVKAFFTLDKKDVVQLAVMATVLLASQDVSFAEDFQNKSNEISTLSTPLKAIEDFMTGTVGKSIATIGAVAFGASWAANIENQITKSAMRIGGGGAVAASAPVLLKDVTGFLF